MKRNILLLLLLAIAIPVITLSNAGRIIEKNIDNLLQWEEKFGFSGAVLIVKEGKIVFNKGYGYANQRMVIPNTSKTVFYIASVSKPVTALGIMKLVEQKKVGLKDALIKYFPDVPENKKDITVEMLLTHTSGFDQTYSCDNITNRSEAITTILTKTPFNAPAGKRYRYSGDNYTLLAIIIELASGEKFERFIAKNVLEPAGIRHNAFAGQLYEITDEAIASPVENARYKSLRNIQATWGRKGRSGMMLSVEDLYKLDKALVTNKIFPSALTEKVLSPKVAVGPGADYGYGFALATTIRGTKIFGHNGDDDGIGHNVEYMNFPDDKVKIFIASNSGLYSGTSWSAIISALIQRFLFGAEFSYQANRLFHTEFNDYSSKAVSPLEGVYKDDNADYHVWINNKGQLIVSPVGENAGAVFGFSKAYAEKNQLARLILEEAGQKKYAAMQNHSKDDAVFERSKATLASLLRSLEERNGPLEKTEILGTANTWSGNVQAEIATWFRLKYKNTSRLYRMEWDGADNIAGFAGSRIPYPMMFTMNAIAKDEYIGFDVANGKTIAVNFSAVDKNNRRIMEVSIGRNDPVLLTNSGSQQLLPLRSAAQLLYSVVLNEGIAEAYRTVKEIKKDISRFDVDDGEINEYGYKLLRANKLNEAIAIFTILTEAFPGSANAFDSLGEAYMKAGNFSEAIKHYKRSLELDPNNSNAIKMIEKMQGGL